MKIKYWGASDVGRKRNHNEDRYLVQPEDQLFVVCDGMGGHACGEVAAEMAINTLSQFFKDTREDEDITWPYKPDKKISYPENRLAVAIKWANYIVHEKAQSSIQQKGMGTTCVAIHLFDNKAAIAHVGDSRCYRIRDHKIEQMTTDHSLLEDYKRMAQLTEEEIKNFPHKNIIVRALGMKETVVVDSRLEEIKQGDVFLLCCDGLSGEVEDKDMLEVVETMGDDLELACSELIARANQHGGKDNITVILVKVLGE